MSSKRHTEPSISESANTNSDLSEVKLNNPLTPVREITSEGGCLILGNDENALEVATKLKDELAVTILMGEDMDDLSPRDEVNICSGKLKTVSGSLGNFKVLVSDYRELNLHGRGSVSFGERRKQASSECDIIIDLRGDNPLFPAAEKRDGYLRRDPKDRVGLESVILDAINLKGEFEKPVYVHFEETKCAHSRASKIGCSRCLEICPTNAISSNGDYVAIDPYVCALGYF